MVLLAGFMTFINLSEAYNIGILDQTGGYPFGGEGPTPYYYETAGLYAKVNLIWGLLFLGTLTYGIGTVFKGQRERTMWTFGLIVFLLIAMWIHGQIGM